MGLGTVLCGEPNFHDNRAKDQGGETVNPEQLSEFLDTQEHL